MAEGRKSGTIRIINRSSEVGYIKGKDGSGYPFSRGNTKNFARLKVGNKVTFLDGQNGHTSDVKLARAA